MHSITAAHSRRSGVNRTMLVEERKPMAWLLRDWRRLAHGAAREMKPTGSSALAGPHFVTDRAPTAAAVATSLSIARYHRSHLEAWHHCHSKAWQRFTTSYRHSGERSAPLDQRHGCVRVKPLSYVLASSSPKPSQSISKPHSSTASKYSSKASRKP